jgi:hypothetical protein
MRVLPLLLAVFLSAIAVSGRASPPQPDPDSVTIHFLLDSAAADFRKHPPQALAFRKVYFGQFDATGEPPQYEICGEFQIAGAGGKKEWLHFVTIKTSGYEQYIGAQASSYCTREGMSWDEDDWSAELLTRYRKK